MSITGNVNVPKIAIDKSKCRIRIHRTTIKALGNPQYVLLLINPEKKTIGLLVSNIFDKKAHRIKYDGLSYEIYSSIFISKIGALMNNFDLGHRFIIDGKIIPNQNLVIFELKDAVAFTNEQQFND